MFHYVFTNDLRITNLEEALKEAGRCFRDNCVPSSSENKSVNNNMTTLGFYFNLTDGSECARQCAAGNIRGVVLNFIKKFQFPNPRTKESLNDAMSDGITLAPMRVILQTLYVMRMIDGENAFLTKKEILKYIFADELVAKTKTPDIVALANRIIGNRTEESFSQIEDDDVLEAKEFYWKHCKRQIGEMLKVMTWSGSIVEDEQGCYRILHQNLTKDNKVDLFDILTYNQFWSPDKEVDYGENRKGYEKYMDIEAEDIVMKPIKPYTPPNYNTSLRSEYHANRIVFGAPGTGKSFKLEQDRQKLLDNDKIGDYERVTFHPDYTYAQFVGAYKPVTDSAGNIKYKFVPGPFMRLYIKAIENGKTNNPQPHLLLIEEINRADVAAVFGDVFQLLDRDRDKVSEYPIQATEDLKGYLAEMLGGVPDDYNSIRIPNNMYIWATMNSADQGVYPMDTAFKRRWDFKYLSINNGEEEISGKMVVLGRGEHQKTVEWNALRKAINAFLVEECKVNEDKLLGPFFISLHDLSQSTEIEAKRFNDVFKNKVIMYLFEDAAKQTSQRLFSGCSDNKLFSSICDEFDDKGIEIFHDRIRFAI